MSAITKMDELKKLIVEVMTNYESIEKGFTRESDSIVNTIKLNIEKVRLIKNELQSIYQEMQSRVAPLESNLFELNKQIKLKEVELSRVTTAFNSKDEELTKGFTEREQTLNELDIKISKASATYDATIADRKEIADSTSKQLAALQKIETGIKLATNELSVIESRKERLTTECGELTNERDILNVDIRNKRAELSAQ